MEILIIFLLVLFVSGFKCTRFEFYEGNHSDDDDLQAAMERSLKNDKSFYYFTPRQTDDYEITVEDDNHCKWISKVEKPYYISNGTTQFPIVQTKHFEQKIRTTRCMNEDKDCGNVVGLDKLNLAVKCTQKYEKLPFYFYDIQKKRILFAYVYVPMCCSCSVVDIPTKK